MANYLIVTEKPSVAKSIAGALGVKAAGRHEGYIEGYSEYFKDTVWVTWCLGHLVQMSYPEAYGQKYAKWRLEDLPILPEQYRYEIIPESKKQFDVVSKLMNSVGEPERGGEGRTRRPGKSMLYGENEFFVPDSPIICATDAGREGELIFRLVYHQCGCKKPFSRLWISSMEDNAIREGFANLRPGTEYDALYEAALCRERADWIVGMNATRLFSVLYGQTLHVGRVVSPTLAMTVLREAQISAFQPETFYTVNLDLQNMTAVSGRIKEKSAAEALAQSCIGETVVVTKCERRERSEKAPALYDLTSLQRDANRQLGYTAQQTLDYTQALYEKKVVTYPRTDSRYLTDDMEEKVPELVTVAAGLFAGSVPKELSVKPVLNSKKVSDHHAIVPTASAGDTDIMGLPAGEREILRMIATRLLASVAPPCRYAETVAEFQCGETVFTAKGKTVLEAGWKAIEKPGKANNRDKLAKTPGAMKKMETSGAMETEDTLEAETSLPVMNEGDMFPVLSAEVKEGQTKPKAHYTEDTLLSAMERAGADEMPDDVERKGIGTPATRAGIIERLVTRGFLERRGDKKTKHLLPTEKGVALITVLPEQLQSASMTADWEEKLLKIERGEYSSDAFMTEIEEMITGLVDTYEVVKDARVIMPEAGKSLGKCPVCGSDVVERPKSYSCVNRQCKFAIWKENRYFESIGKRMNESTAKRLLKNGSIPMKGCYSRRLDKYFDATIFMTVDEEGKARFQMEKGGTE